MATLSISTYQSQIMCKKTWMPFIFVILPFFYRFWPMLSNMKIRLNFDQRLSIFWEHFWHNFTTFLHNLQHPADFASWGQCQSLVVCNTRIYDPVRYSPESDPNRWLTNGFQQSQLIIPLSPFHELLGDFRLTKDDFSLSKPYLPNQPKGILDIRLAQPTHYPNYSPGNQIPQIITI